MLSHNVDIVRDAILALDADKASQCLLEECVHLTGSATGRFYRLRLGASKFVAEVQYRRPDEVPDLSAQIIDKNVDTAESLLEQVILSKQLLTISDIEKNPLSKYHSSQAASRLLVPIVRDGECLGVIDLDSPRRDHYRRDVWAAVETLGTIMIAILERRSYIDLLAALSHPMNFYQPLESFLDELLIFIAVACQMPFFIIREFDGKQCLRSIATYGFGNSELSQFDLDPLDEYPTFQRAILDNIIVVEPNIKAPHLLSLQKIKAMSPIRSFVAVPIIVGREKFGVLSFGSTIPHQYSPLELAGFKTIANIIGASITNYRNVHLLSERNIELAKMMTLLNIVDVIQAARHETRGLLEDCQISLANIMHLVVKPTKENLSKVRALTDNLSENLSAINLSLDKIKAASKPPQLELTTISVPDVWREAFAIMAGKLDNYRIRPRIIGPNVTAEAYRNLLRNAFLQLILNSIDAFKDRKKIGDREIVVTIDPQSESARVIKIRYMDNATGIDFSKLYYPSGIDLSKPPEELLFNVGVTSKTGASGYGLYLVRKIMTDHKGYIELVSYRNGVVFNLYLPKR